MSIPNITLQRNCLVYEFKHSRQNNFTTPQTNDLIHTTQSCILIASYNHADQYKDQIVAVMVGRVMFNIPLDTRHIRGHFGQDIFTGLLIQPTVSKH